MYATSGDWLRRAVPATIITLGLALSACSGSDSEPTDDVVQPTTEATVDPAVADQQALETLVTDFWAVRTSSQNNGDTSPEQFVGLLSDAMIEVETGTLADYEELKVVRVGAPEITAVEATASGDEGRLLACVNEDEWTAEEDGKPVQLSQDGPKAWGAVAARLGDSWIITDFLSGDEAAKEKTC